MTLCGCTGHNDGDVTLYLKQRLGPDGPPGQIAPVLEPVERQARPSLPPEVQALVQLRQGPTPDERARGFEQTIDPGTRFPGVEIDGGTAFVEMAGKPLDFYGVAAVVWGGWQGAPCALRTENRCLRASTRLPDPARLASIR